MPRRITMGNLVTRARQLVDLATSDTPDPATEWKWFASMVYGEMCSEVSIGVASRYFETSTTITADGSTSYDEPVDHYSTVRVVEIMGDGTERPLRELQQHEEAHYRGRTGTAVGWVASDDQLYLCPAPSSGTFKWYYIAQPTDLSEYADDDVVDVVNPAGEAFMIWGMAALALGKLERNVQFAMSQKQAALGQLQFTAANRNLTDTKTRGGEPDEDNYYVAPNDWRMPR